MGYTHSAADSISLKPTATSLRGAVTLWLGSFCCHFHLTKDYPLILPR